MKLYESYEWMRRRYLREKKTPEQIAQELGVSHMTIRRWLDKHKLLRK